MDGGWRAEAKLLFGLIGLAGLAITQPLLDVFGSEPEQLLFRGVGPASAVVFAVAIVVVPPLVLYVVSALVGLVASPLRPGVHAGCIGVLVAAWILQLSAPVATVGLVVGGIAGLAAAVAYARFDNIRLWAAVTAVFQLLYLATFLFVSPSSDLIWAGDVAAVELEREPVADDGDDVQVADPFADVMIILLDELPVSTLLGSDGGVQQLRYPNLAQFAAEATWYPRYTTSSAQTKHALPTMVSGVLPVEDVPPLWTEHPDNLFRLLANVYHLTVSESFSKLCAPSFCPQDPAAPPLPVDDSTDAPEEQVDEAPRDVTVDRGGLGRLLDDAASLWFDRLDAPVEDVPLNTGFTEVAEVAASTTTTISPTADVGSAFVGDADDLVEDIVNSAGQVQRVEQFVDALGPSSQPTLSFLHLVLPHRPLIFNEVGARYQSADLGTGWGADWDAVLSRQRHSWQTQLADAAVGAVLDEMRANGTYDDALVIVLADHGASFDPEEPFRYFSGRNAADLITPPLFIKYPGQVAAEMSDVTAQSHDILATIADVVDVQIPWAHEGTSLVDGSASSAGACDPRTYVRFGVGLFDDDDGVESLSLCFDDFADAALSPALPDLLDRHEYPSDALADLTPYGSMVGEDFGVVVQGASEVVATIAEPETFDIGAGSMPPGLIYGGLDRPVDEAWAAVSLNGQIVGISPIFDRFELSFFDRGDDTEHTVDQFVVPVPIQRLQDGVNTIEVALIAGDPDAPVLTEVETVSTEG